MKRKTILSGCTTLTLALLLTACSTGAPEPNPAEGAQLSADPLPAASAALSQELESPQWSSQVFAQTYYAQDHTMVMDVRYTLPMVQNTAACPAGTAINQWYQEYGNQCLATAAENAAAAEGDYDASQSTGLPFTPVSEEMSYEVLLDSPQVISISRTWYIGSGAAYPTVFQLGDSFDTRTGIKLGAADFFTDSLSGGAVLPDGRGLPVLDPGQRSARPPLPCLRYGTLCRFEGREYVCRPVNTPRDRPILLPLRGMAAMARASPGWRAWWSLWPEASGVRCARCG